MRFRLRTLLILMAAIPPILAVAMPPLVARLWPQPQRQEIKMDFLFEPIWQGVQSPPVWDYDHANEGLYNSIWLDPGTKR